MMGVGPSRLRILVVEDNADIRQILLDLLQGCGHDVRVAADGESGLAELKKHRYDLLITDLGLPGISGWDLSKASKRYQSNMAILAISSWQGRKSLSNIEEFGIGRMIWKPFRLDQIKEAIHSLCRSDREKFPVNET